ncbi:SusC/RagA family TonB-linked outer membrane protein [Pedobacter metabolipauper]|nr:SusC/RagA family TonB-linked outer membrane protein [Pedobacter metabolipauper]
MRKNILFLSIMFCALMINTLQAQTTKIVLKGIVSERATNLIMPGVSISTGKPGKVIAVTNAKGEFSVAVDEGATLTITYTGFNPQIIKLKADQTTLNVLMTESNNQLTEVVVRGYQIRSKETSTGSSFTISGDQVQDVPVSNVEQLLQGKVAGLNIQVNTGAPGFRGSAAIRGLSTLTVTGTGDDSFLQPTSPLYVIDGVPIDADKAAEYGYNTLGPGVSPLSLIPQEDVASLEVLKDAQATSLYGSRGAYGVIIITTKRGNSKIPRVRYTTNFYVNTPPKLRETLGGNSERQSKINHILANAINEDDFDRLTRTFFLADSLNDYYNNSTNWQGIFFQSTYNQTHNLALDGGDTKFNYKTNIGYSSEKGVIKNTGYDRYNMNMNMEYNPTERFRFFAAVNGGVGKQNKGNGSGLLQTGVASNGQASSLLPGPSFFQSSAGTLASLRTLNNNDSRNIRANIDARFQIIPGLWAATSVSYDYTSDNEDTFTPAAAANQFARVYSFNGRSSNLYNRNNLSYSKTLGTDHNIFVNVFNEMSKETGQAGLIEQVKTANDQFQGPLGFDAYFSRGGGVLPNFKNRHLASFAAAFSYDYKKKYIIDLSYRLDGSSLSGLENPYSKNPSIGFRWNFNKEAWFKDQSWLSYSAFRLTWGRNVIPNGNLQSIYGLYNIKGTYNNNPAIGIDYGAVPNPTLKPTTTSQYNLGFDMGFFDSRIELNFDTYFKKVDNLLVDRYLNNTTGFERVLSNDGGIINYGYELAVIFRPLPRSNPFDWSISLNGAINRDVLTKLPAEYNGQYIRRDGSQYIVNRVGKNTFSNFLIINQGVFGTDANVPVDPVTGLKYQTGGRFFQGGDPIFKDVNGDYILDNQDYQITGNSMPLITGGLSTNVNYKGWGLNIYGSFTLLRTILNNALADRFRIMSDPFDMRSVVPLDDLDTWKQPGDNSKYPYAYDYARYGQINPFRYDQTLWAEEGSYFKFNTITLSYRFTKQLAKIVGLNNFRTYISANNLITLSPYSGPNPENVTALGRDASNGYPVPRTYNIGFNVEF